MERKKQNKRFYPTEEDPRYGKVFQVIDIQFEDIDRNYTGWTGIRYADDRLLEIGKDWSQWKKNKSKISDDFTLGINSMMKKDATPYKDVVALKVHYLGDPRGKFQIL